MKTYTAKMAVFAVLAVITMVGSAFAGQTQAEREWTLNQNLDPESVLGWQVRSPVATGSLPADEVLHMKSGTMGTSRFPTVEIGGTVYRTGIDTN